MNNDNDLEMTEAEKASLAASRAAISDLANAMVEGTDPETAEAALAAVQQANTQLDLDAIRDKLHVPDDAGEFEEDLRAIMMRIPDGWGRWVSCSAGWYPIVVQLDRDLAAIDPDYALKQVKEKFGGLRYYFHTELEGAREPMNTLVKAAEEAAERTCEDCGRPGELYVSRHGWYRTLCASCAAEKPERRYRLANERVDKLTPDLPGAWMVKADDGEYSVWDLQRMTFGTYGDNVFGERVPIARVITWPAVGGFGEVQLEDGTVRVTGTVTEIKRVR